MAVTKTNETGAAGSGRTVAEIAGLFEVVGREAEAISRLDGCLAHLHEVQRAKAQLNTLSAAELRAALEVRRATLRAEQTA